MKAKELAELLLKYPDFDIKIDICTERPTYDYPWINYTSFKVKGIEDIAYSNKVIALEVEEV